MKPQERSKKICPYPFSRMELGSTEFIPCCNNWLSPKLFFYDPGEDPWNGKQAQELRQRILNGDFSLCRRELCKIPLASVDELREGSESFANTPISEKNLDAIEKGLSVLPDGPISVCVIADPRCNLNCPSCRAEYIHQLSPENERQISLTEKFLEEHRTSIRVIKAAGNGEVFFSPWLRDLLKNLSKDRFPMLSHVDLHSNGLLFTPANFEALRPGADLIKSVMISIDAGTAETYSKVRGGNWDKLMRNLEWISDQRKSGRFAAFSISFVTRLANYRTIPQFVELGKRLGVDRVDLTPLMDWKKMGIQDFEKEAVHLPTHPEYSRLMEICRPFANDARVWIGF